MTSTYLFLLFSFFSVFSLFLTINAGHTTLPITAPVLLTDSTTLTVNNSTAVLYFKYNDTETFYLLINEVLCNSTQIEVGVWECMYNFANVNTSQVWPVYYSFDTYDYYSADVEVTHYVYNNVSSITSSQFYNNFDIDTTDTLAISGISLWIVVVGLLTTFTVVSVLFVLRFYYPYEINSFLYHIDYLHINIYGDVPISDELNPTGEIKIGMGVEVKQRTSVLGGFLTIIISIISAFAITSYFYDTLNNNVQYISTFSINSNNVIPLEQSFLTVELQYVNVLGNESDVWSTNAVGLPTGTTEIDRNYILGRSVYNCSIRYSCNDCSLDVGKNAQILSSVTGGNIAYTSLFYKISINSYSGVNILNGSYITNGVWVSGIDNSLSVSVVPTSYINQYGDKQTGYILDYQNSILGSHLTVNQYTNYMNYPDISTAGFVINLSRNPSWYNIVQSVKYTGLIVFSQLFAIVGGISTISIVVYNVIASKTVRKVFSCSKCRSN